ncbi:ABC transporter ATP-binding protein [Alicyclobacillus fastidiosus]|uniref:ABC transporter ATP-binding protein n=1 Tax=Alicyclobacillus fastidiosus TaxID=392011 RepID=A0ABV5ALG4_9BACL|nr:ABC transporter ATP-binding protein [Alicyclobacillus fastidiosus]WEH11065.1 ABC transporter ATP-binding protein [Alicyclobacillus fastidiosus]
MTTLQMNDVSIAYESKIIVENLNLTLPESKITALVGPNGSGKSTILKTLARILRPSQGIIYLDGKSIHQYPTKEVAKKLSILPQNPIAPEGLSVRDLVSYGRSPYQSGLQRMSKEDLEMIQWAIDVTGVNEFIDRPVDALSGGQRQRAWIAMAIAQGTDILLLDEPTTFLDMAHQFEVLELLKRLNETQHCTIVMVVHDLNHAARFAHYMAVIRSGSVVREGSPSKVLTPDILRDVFRIRADVVGCLHTGVPICIPYGLLENY